MGINPKSLTAYGSCNKWPFELDDSGVKLYLTFHDYKSKPKNPKIAGTQLDYAWKRYLSVQQKGKVPQETMPLALSEVTLNENDKRETYYCTIGEKHVTAFVPDYIVSSGEIRVPKELDVFVHNSYTTEGSNRTASWIAMELQWPLQWIKAYIKARSLHKASPCNPDWLIAEANIDSLSDNVLQIKSAKVRRKSDKAYQRLIEKQAKLGTSFEEQFQYMTEILKTMPKSLRQENITVSQDFRGTVVEPYTLVMPLTDIHVGDLGLNAGRGYSLQDQIDTFHAVIEKSIKNSLELWGQPERIIITTGNDQSHSDNVQMTTTRGTPQAQQSIGGWEDQIEALMEIRVRQIELLRALAPNAMIDDYLVKANHDEHTGFMMAMCLQSYFRDDPMYKQHITKEFAQFTQVGRCPVMLVHGSWGIGSDKQSAHFLAANAPGGSDIRYGIIFRGHTHTKASSRKVVRDLKTETDVHGIEIYVGSAPSICGANSWEKKNFGASRHGIINYRVCPKLGVTGWYRL